METHSITTWLITLLKCFHFTGLVLKVSGEAAMLVSVKDQGADSPREAFVQSVFAQFQEAGGEDKRL